MRQPRMRFGRRTAGVIGTLIVLSIGMASVHAAAVPIPPGENLNPQARRVVRTFLELDNPPIPSLSPENARQLATIQDAAKAVQSRLDIDPQIEPVADVSHILIPGPGGELVARVYRPFGHGPFPILVYFHGGGWVIANLDTYDSSARALTNAARFIVVSVAYRQAPEHPFPAAAEDAFASMEWVMDHAQSLGGIPGKVAVGGESAGGNLAAVAALMARDKGAQLPIYQLLVYPITNDNFDTRSYRQEAHDVPLSRPLMKWFWGHYLADPSDGADPYASPLRADLHGLPAATVITDQEDPLRSEGRQYALKLRQAGVDVVYRKFTGVMHEFFGMPAVIDKAKQAVALAARGLRSAV